MQTKFSTEQLFNPDIASSNVELSACLQCGYCVDNCPTYQLLDDEYDSPRGRIYQINELLEKSVTPDRKTVDHLDRCLSCLACMSTCPSSVNYMHLMDHARAFIEKNYKRPVIDRLSRWLLASILPYPGRFRLALRAAWLVRPFSSIMPGTIRTMVALAPETLPPSSQNDRPQIFPAIGERKRRVALLTGCAQQVLNTDINDSTVRILRRHGCEVVIAQGSGCCGALTHHMGKTDDSHAAAARNIHAWMEEVNGEGLDAIVINTSGCGTVVKDYAYIFRNDVLSEQAATISALTKDISEVLSDIELDFKIKPDLRVAYHATCSLQFGQRVRFVPKKLLKSAGFAIVEPRESHTCCGSAGTYNMLQSEISSRLKEQKVATLESIRPDVIAAGNIGCMIQIGSGTKVPVVHTVELLDWVTGGPIPHVLEKGARTLLPESSPPTSGHTGSTPVRLA
ncbi:MAG TPA: glycolate oxidase subunit GlcF [Gammaproteobacteria bacterium]|nr:glycolate oxidase subunit GlcF [Gammaproteobacteria bacterium]